MKKSVIDDNHNIVSIVVILTIATTAFLILNLSIDNNLVGYAKGGKGGGKCTSNGYEFSDVV